MTPFMAKAILNARKKRIKAYNNARFIYGSREYKLSYEGGFFGFLVMYDRPMWKHRGRFNYVCSFAEDDINTDDVIGFMKDYLISKGVPN